MKSETNNPHWTDDPAQHEKFFTEVDPTIDRESRRWARFYGVVMDREDVAQDMRLKLWLQMGKIDTDEPFAKGSPKEAADSLISNYQIREPVRSDARRLGDKQKRQAEILAKVSPPDLPQDIETELFAIVQRLPLIASATPNFTPRDREILFKEVLRQIDLDDLPASKFDQAAQAVGISSSELRSYIKDHDEDGHSSPSDRKAWSRARAKVLKAFTRAKLASLLVIVLALSLGLYNAIRQGRSIGQDDFVNQCSSIHQNYLARPDNLIYQKARAHQINLIHRNARAHQLT